MKKNWICLFLIAGICTSANVFAQQSIMSEINYNQLERYIAAAKQNYPRKKIMAMNTESAKASVSMANLSFLDVFNASYFYRPDDGSTQNPANPYIVNGFQFGVNVNLGSLFQKPGEIKKAKAELAVAQLEEQEYNSMLENEVKTRYYNYIQQLNELKLKTQTAQDSKTITDDLQNKFNKGEITLQAYNVSRIGAADSSSDRIATEVEFLKAKDALEQIIGKKLEEVK
jgi:outer membrane protein TolC